MLDIVYSSEEGCCLVPLVIMLMGFALAYAGASKYLLIQKIRNTPTSKVRSAAVGLVELFGKAKQDKKLSSPVTLKPCVYWRIKAEHYHYTGKNSEWRTFYGRDTNDQFYLSDETGKMLVDPSEAEVNVEHDFFYQGHLTGKTFLGLIPQRQLDKIVLDYLKRDQKVADIFNRQGGKEIRLYEYIIRVDDPVYVLGSAAAQGGKVSSTGHENLIIKKDEHDKLMYISDKSEKELLSKMDLTSWALLIGGIMFAGFGVLLAFAMASEMIG
jgi:hypothetical protein